MKFSADQLLGGSDDSLCPGMTIDLLSHYVNEWMEESFQIPVKFDPSEPVQHLENLKILSKTVEGKLSKLLVYF